VGHIRTSLFHYADERDSDAPYHPVETVSKTRSLRNDSDDSLRGGGCGDLNVSNPPRTCPKRYTEVESEVRHGHTE
jgi:hypothetical protein